MNTLEEAMSRVRDGVELYEWHVVALEKLKDLYDATVALNDFRPSLADMARLGDSNERHAIINFWMAFGAINDE